MKPPRATAKSSRESIDTTSIDVAALATAIERAYATGGLNARAVGDQATEALTKAYAIIGDQQKTIKELTEHMKTISEANVGLATIQHSHAVEIKTLELQNNAIVKGFETAKELAPFLKRLGSGPSGADQAESGQKSGKAALLRLFGEILDRPDVTTTLQSLAGADDWKLITAYAAEMATA